MTAISKSKNLLELLPNLTPMRILKWAESSNEDEQETADQREPAEYLNGANVATSLRREATFFTPKHAVLLDLDVPAYLVPSSTPGHSHLYIDVSISEPAYFRLLDALAQCGIIEEGYAKASKAKGATYLRLPWIKKGREIVMGRGVVDPVMF